MTGKPGSTTELTHARASPMRKDLVDQYDYKDAVEFVLYIRDDQPITDYEMVKVLFFLFSMCSFFLFLNNTNLFIQTIYFNSSRW